MKFLFMTILLVGFVGIALFGAFGVFGVHEGMQSHGGTANHAEACVVAAAQGIDCPKQINLIGYITFHLEAYKGFSLAVLGANALGAFLSVVASLIVIGFALLSPQLSLSPQHAFHHRRGESFLPSQTQELRHWLAFHQNSPAIF